MVAIDGSFSMDGSIFDLPNFPDELELKEVCRAMSSVCKSFAEELPKTASGWTRCRTLIVLLLIIEVIRYCWHRIRLVALNFRRHTPPSTAYTLNTSFDEHAAFVEEIFCEHKDLKFTLEALFQQRRELHTITRDMMEDAVQAHLAMEVRRWYPKKHRIAADRIIARIEKQLGHEFQRSDSTREVMKGGASISQPIRYDAHPDDSRKPYLYIGEQRLCAYFKPLPTQCTIWLAKMLKSFLLRRWGFKWHNLGAVQMWVRHPQTLNGRNPDSSILYCPGLFLGNTAYLYWIAVGLLPLAETRSLFLLELPHLSHGIDPLKLGYSLRYSWPSSDEISDAIANFLHSHPGPIDVVGNSFGTVVMTALRREHKHLFRKFVYVDPVCFVPCFPTPSLASTVPWLDSYKSLAWKALKDGGSRPSFGRLFKYLVLRPSIFGDLEVQYVMKRGLYIHESTERGSDLGKETLVILGSQDELLHDPSEVRDYVARQWPDVSIRWMDFNHGAMMGHPAHFAKLVWEFLKHDA